jgi:hypothetical protein
VVVACVSSIDAENRSFPTALTTYGTWVPIATLQATHTFLELDQT